MVQGKAEHVTVSKNKLKLRNEWPEFTVQHLTAEAAVAANV